MQTFLYFAKGQGLSRKNIISFDEVEQLKVIPLSDITKLCPSPSW
jgi:hypothetical protein